MSEFRTRIRVVRPKSGGEIRLLPDRRQDDEKIVLDWCRDVIEKHAAGAPSFSGFALVIWGFDGTSTCTTQVKDGSIPSILVPDFVRNRLLAERIEKWTLDTLEGR